MPRIARAIATGCPHHIIQRGNNREKVFFKTEDKKKYLSLLRNYSQNWDSPILAYCLMNNHVHLLTRPYSNQSLYKMMQGVTLCYTQYVNKKYQRTGRLWESRYYSCIIEAERYLWAVTRYIEQNPVRAHIEERAEDYSYSSAKAHVRGMKDEVLGEELFDEALRGDYIQLLNEKIPESQMTELRSHIRTGSPLGCEAFRKMMERKLQRSLFPRRRGRPRKVRG